MKKESQLHKNMTLVINELTKIIKDNNTEQQTKINACESLIYVCIQVDKINKDDLKKE